MGPWGLALPQIMKDTVETIDFKLSIYGQEVRQVNCHEWVLSISNYQQLIKSMWV